jgi:uncharacterized protein DUF2516
MDLLTPLYTGLGLLGLVLLGLKAFALVDAAIRPANAYAAAEKLQKNFWLIVLGLAVIWNMISPGPIGIINIIGLIAAIVYLVDVRPAVKAIGKGGPQTGPYGPW